MRPSATAPRPARRREWLSRTCARAGADWHRRYGLHFGSYRGTLSKRPSGDQFGLKYPGTVIWVKITIGFKWAIHSCAQHKRTGGRGVPSVGSPCNGAGASCFRAAGGAGEGLSGGSPSPLALASRGLLCLDARTAQRASRRLVDDGGGAPAAPRAPRARAPAPMQARDRRAPAAPTSAAEALAPLTRVAGRARRRCRSRRRAGAHSAPARARRAAPARTKKKKNSTPAWGRAGGTTGMDRDIAAASHGRAMWHARAAERGPRRKQISARASPSTEDHQTAGGARTSIRCAAPRAAARVPRRAERGLEPALALRRAPALAHFP